jgi:hypothetical protein
VQVAAHELGHNFGRNHAPCGGAGGPDPSYPYPDAKLGTYGWNGAQLLSPTQFVDLMSYCNPGWVSDYSYEGVQQFMAGRMEFDPGAMLPDVVQDDVVMFAGRVSPSGVVTLSDPQRFHGRATRRLDTSDAVVVQTLADGREVRVPVSLVQTSEGEERQFVVVTPYLGELRRWAFELERVVLAQRESDESTFAPQVRLTRVSSERIRVTWRGAKSVLVAHVSPEGERTTLTVDARGGSVELLPPARAGRFEVSASDGVRSRSLTLE